MFRFDERCPRRPRILWFAASIWLVALPATVSAQAEGGLYIAGDGFSFQAAADQGMAKNPRGRRFFLLSLPPETAALARTAARPLAAVRERVVAANGVLFVCQRDVDNGSLDLSLLVPEVIAVRGWPSPGSPQIPKGQRYFPDENPAVLPKANNSLRRLRTTCS
ncbi:MAG: hypothetical protein V5B34_12230 [Accumulibacter sp.]|jgi:hypothetical protein